MSKFPVVWNSGYETLPLDAEQESIGASRIRDLKIEVRERMQQDHSWAGDDSDGYHMAITLLPQAADPTPTPASGTASNVYSKTINGNNELFYKDSSGAVIQLTTAGELNFSAASSGDVKATAASAAPAGWVFCRGQLLDGTQPANTALWNAIGLTYGGTGKSSFAVPDLRGRTIFGLDPGNATNRLTNPTEFGGGINGAALGNVGGLQDHAQQPDELAVHAHGVTDPGHAHSYTSPSNQFGTGNGGNPTTSTGIGATTGTAFTGIAIDGAGSGSAMNITPPGIVLNWLIKL